MPSKKFKLKENNVNTWKKMVSGYLGILNESRNTGGYEALATRLSRDLGKEITSSKVKSYLKKKETEMKKEGKWKYLMNGEKMAKNKGAYKWGKSGAMYKILKGHFS
jgi:hypothetical protein